MEDPIDKLDEFNNNREPEDLGVGWKILAVIIPLAGAIMFFNHRSSNERKSKSACTFALIGLALSFVLRLIGAALAAG